MRVTERTTTRLALAVLFLSASACGAGGGDDDPDASSPEANGARPGSPCAGEEDWGIDSAVDVRWRYFEDERGRDIRDEGHYDGDGVPDNLWQYEWTDGGQLAARQWSLTGEVVFSEATRFDPGGNPVERAADPDGDGPSPPDTTRYRHDGDRLAEEISDRESDGVIEERRAYQYDGAGLLGAVAVDRADDGAIDVREIHSHDASGWLRRIDYDHPVGGSIEDVEQFWHDEDGRLIRRVRDNGRDGTADSTMTAIYDGEGRLVEQTVDYDGDGSWPAQVTRHEYNAEGRLASVRVTGLHETYLAYQFSCAD